MNGHERAHRVARWSPFAIPVPTKLRQSVNLERTNLAIPDSRPWRTTKTIMMMIATRTSTTAITMGIMVMIRLKDPGMATTNGT